VYQNLLGLPQAWRGRTQFTIIESSFDEGLRFLELWDAWRADPERSSRLHIVSFCPILPSKAALRANLSQRAHSRLQKLADQLIAAWPMSLPGVHRLDFEGLAVTLTIMVGTVSVTVPRLIVSADAILFSDIQALSQDELPNYWRAVLPQFLRDPRTAALATLTASLAFDRSLPKQHVKSLIDPLLMGQAVMGDSRHAIVVGAGVAGVGVAQALALRGWHVTVIDEHKQRVAAHGKHLAAALTPMVTRDDDLRARLSRAGSLRAQARWAHVSQESLWRCGALQLQRVTGRVVDLAALVEGLPFPDDWVRYVGAEEASLIAGLPLSRPGLYFPTAARIQPERLISELIATPGIERIDAQAYVLKKKSENWQVLDRAGQVLALAPHVILAAAHNTQALLQQSGLVLEEGGRLAVMHRLGGEVTMFPAEGLGGGPRCIVSGDGYVLPALDGECLVGSSYVHGAEHADITAGGMSENLRRAQGLLGAHVLANPFNNAAGPILRGWAGWRAVLPGRLPAVGPLTQAEGLWVATGYASRGLTWASLAGDLIAAALNGEPLPLERDIIEKISQI
jgi:tRNA 5-methylaminomethyl-2-thiouridine biosynthesis bifunctional protein